MMPTRVCEGCGEEFIGRHSSFCDECSVVPIRKVANTPVILKQVNERNKESKLRERGKKRRKPVQYDSL